MKSTRTLLITIPLVMLIAGLVGFLITYTSSPQPAFARVFIDLGVIIALFCVTLTIPKPPILRTHDIVDALRDLVRGRYDRRLDDKEFAELSDIAQAFNELAGVLSDSRDFNTSHLRYRVSNKDSSDLRPIVNERHSYHPELGPVKSLSDDPVIQKEEENKTQDEPEPEVESPINTSERNEEPKIGDEDLYKTFCETLLKMNQIVVDYEFFKATIDRARADLLTTHGCDDVRFEIVMESGEVALRPRLVRC